MHSTQNILALVMTEPARIVLLAVGLYSVITAFVTAALMTAALRGSAYDAALDSAFSQRQATEPNLAAVEPVSGETARSFELIQA